MASPREIYTWDLEIEIQVLHIPTNTRDFKKLGSLANDLSEVRLFGNYLSGGFWARLGEKSWILVGLKVDLKIWYFLKLQA